MYNDIYTVYRSGCGCESRAEQIVYYDDSDVTGAWPMRVLSSNLCVTRENASNNSPVCHRKPLLSPHNPLQQPNTTLSIWYNHQDIYQQYCTLMKVYQVELATHPSPEKGYTSISGSIISTKATFWTNSNWFRIWCWLIQNYPKLLRYLHKRWILHSKIE